MYRKAKVDGMDVDRMLARYLDINEEWIIGVNINADGIEVEYDDPNDDEEQNYEK